MFIEELKDKAHKSGRLSDDELNTIIPDLPPTNGMSLANVDAANTLLMKLYLKQ